MESQIYWWLQFPVQINEIELESWHLFEDGAIGVQESENTPVQIKGFFDDIQLFNIARNKRSKYIGLQYEKADNHGWVQDWEKNQKPISVTQSLTVYPPWYQIPAVGTCCNLKVETKMAFGNGRHESTRICALLMQALQIKGMTFLDFGAGTGILSFYAAYLGANRIIAADIDINIRHCLSENMILNLSRVSPAAQIPSACFLIGSLNCLRLQPFFDMIVTNMIRSEIWPLKDHMLSRAKKGAYFIISGQLFEEKDYWVDWLNKRRHILVEEVQINEWWGFLAQVHV